jgi:hypothetical protein
MKFFELIDAQGNCIAELAALDVQFIERGIDFQPNIFNGYHAIELGEGNPPAVLNLPEGMNIRRVA